MEEAHNGRLSLFSYMYDMLQDVEVLVDGCSTSSTQLSVEKLDCQAPYVPAVRI